ACMSLTAYAQCEMPTVIEIPDGATSTENELLAAQERVRGYISAMDAYIACTNNEISVSGDDATAQFLLLMSQRIDEARAEVDLVVTRFNDQVVAFRAANPNLRQPGFRPGQPAGGPGQAPGGFPGQGQGGFPGQNPGGLPGQNQGGFPGQGQGAAPGQAPQN
ncbi:MAG: hypothetical protein R3305_06595, partial [Gammaproteobacteria bacterium]|nr:hypothetical protein [Gammaproteobacteria bacterium]